MKNNILEKKHIISIIILALIPVIFWISSYDMSTAFSTTGKTLSSLAQISGLIGVVLFSLNIIISIRGKYIEKFFINLGNLYKVHKYLGIFSFLLLSLHPIFLTFNFLRFSIPIGINYILSISDPIIVFGKISLIGLILMIVTSLFIKMKYKTWNIVHKILSFSFFFGFLHIFFINSTISKNMGLRFYILSIASTALIILVYKGLLNFKIFRNEHKYELIKLNILTDNILELNLKSKSDKKMNFQEGQFVFIKIKQKGLSEKHPFSISSSTNSDILKLTIKNLGDYTYSLKDVKEGVIVDIEGPYGNFYKISDKDEIFIAGGIGITPFLSILRSRKDTTKKTTLFYCSKNKNEVVFLDELKSMENENLKIIEVFSENRGRLSIDDIKSINYYNNSNIFMCGSLSLVNNIKNQLLKDGFKKENIYNEEFNFK